MSPDVVDEPWIAEIKTALPQWFEDHRPIATAQAHGRIDLLGGFADYSGATVVETPIAERTQAAVQCTADGEMAIVSVSEDGSEAKTRIARFPAGAAGPLWHRPYAQIREHFASCPKRDQWASYVAGVVAVFVQAGPGIPADAGLRIAVSSNVPEGKGVSSSASLEVAVMRALAAAVHQRIEPRQLALLCQLAENQVVGAPCGVMDQMTASVVDPGELLVLRCQPAEILAKRTLPAGLKLWGIDSGVRHAVSGDDYGGVRVGTFMGRRILRDLIEERGEEAPVYLADVRRSDFEARDLQRLPLRLGGAEFLDRYGDHEDPTTTIDPDRTYAVRLPTRHPIAEQDRAEQLLAMFDANANDDAPLDRGQLKNLLLASHESYSACGLGCEQTDAIVKSVLDCPAKQGLIAAKITGGGSGGMVAVISNESLSATRAVAQIGADHHERFGSGGQVFAVPAGRSVPACVEELEQL